MAKSKQRTIAYLRVSTTDQDLEKFENDVLRFAHDRDLGKVEFIQEKISGKVNWQKRKIKTILDDLADGDRFITPELTRLGRSTLEVLEILRAAKEKNITVHAVKERMDLYPDDSSENIQTTITVTMLSLFAELERKFISMRTKEALKARKAQGVKLGRPKGPGKSKLDDYRDEIIALLKTGVPKTKVASKYRANRTTLQNWLAKNQIDLS